MIEERIPKVWGEEIVLHNDKNYCAKRLLLMKGAVSSLHYHKSKMETFYISSGRIFLELNGEKKEMFPGDHVTILPGQSHRFSGAEDSEIAEFSTLHQDSDVVRLAESYLAPVLYGVDVDGTLLSGTPSGRIEAEDLAGKEFVIISSRSKERSMIACEEIGIEPLAVVVCRVVSRAEEMRHIDRLYPVRRTIYIGDQLSDKSEAERAGWKFLFHHEVRDLKLGLCL